MIDGPSENKIQEILTFWDKRGHVYGYKGVARKFNITQYYVKKIIKAHAKP